MNMEINTMTLSKNRGSLMGIAILWVMSFHLVSKGPSFCDFSIFSPIMGIGYGGVDIFMFLSGLGLYFSYSNKPIYKSFIWNRIIRIMPAYIIVNIVYGVVIGLKPLTVLLNISTIGFWSLSEYYDWYIPSIILLYILFPLVFSAVNKSKINDLKKGFLTNRIVIFSFFIVTILITMLYIITDSNLDDMRMLFIARIPVFILGIVFGRIVKKKLHISLLPYIFIMLVAIAMLFLVKNQNVITIHLGSGILQILFLFITPGLCLLLSVVLDHLSSKVNNVLAFIGSMSLELYIIHLHIFEAMPFYYGKNLPFYLVILILLIFLASYILSKVCRMFHNILTLRL